MPHADDEYKGQNYYALRGLQSDATEKKIRDAKKAKFILHTPDGGASPNASLLAMINHAADVLLKPAAREAYDVYWEREFASQPVEVVNPPPASPPPASVRPDVVFDDFFAGVELPEDLATRKSSMLYALLAWQRQCSP